MAKFGKLTVGRQGILAQNGNVVTLRGMSLFWSQWGHDYYTSATINRLVDDWKIDVVRAALGVEPAGYLDHPSREMRKIETVIEAAIRRNIYVIVDWHAHRPVTHRALEAFSYLASRYGAHPNLLWEPWNEPLVGDDWQSVIAPHHCAIIDRIREVGANGLIICGTPNYCTDLQAAANAPLNRQNIAYSLHFYAGTHGTALRRSASAASKDGLPIFVSEYGLGNADGNGKVSEDEMCLWWKWLDLNSISHVNWSLFDKDEACSAIRKRGIFQPRYYWRLSKSGAAVRSNLRRRAQNPT